MIDQEKLHNQCLSDNPKERIKAIKQLKDNFSLLTDKQKAWENLIKLTSDKDENVRFRASYALRSVFSQMPAKKKAWEDLHRLTNDQKSDVRSSAAFSLGFVFSQVPDKQQAWNDLHKLTSVQEKEVRRWATHALDSIFSHIPDKQKAWEDLHRLTSDKEWRIRFEAASILGSAYSHVPDKQQAWNDLHRLTSDKDEYVRSEVANALGSIFSHVHDKQKTWEDLSRLTYDRDSSVIAYANHSLAKASIFQASQARTEEDYKNELERAIEFYEKAAHESIWKNPSQFCLPFYRSFHTIVFEKQEPKEEVDKYLAEAKEAIKGSKSKETLLEAVENLAEALKEVQSLENLDLEAKKGKLNFYRKYCDRAAELMRDAEETAPFATITIRKGLPILDRNLKELLEEIQKKTEVIREQTRGTQFEKLGNELNQNSQFLLQVRDPVGFKKQVNNMQNTMRAICSKFPEDQKGEACELLKIMYAEPSIEDKIPLMVNILSRFSYQLDMTTQLNRIEEKLDQKLSCISFDIFKIKLNSYNIISNLDAMKKELEKLNKIEGLNTLSIETLNSTQADKLNNLTSDLLGRLDEINILIDEFSRNDDEFYQEFSKRLDELKQSKLDTLLQRYSAIISLMGFVISAIPVAR